MQDPGFDVWDTPTPPDLAKCPVPPERKKSIFRYHTLDMTAVSGITFFLRGATMMAIYGHTRSQPSAWRAYETFRDVRGMKRCVWIYVPLASRDTVLSCGPLVSREAIALGRAGCRYPYFLVRLTPISRFRGAELLLSHNHPKLRLSQAKDATVR